MPLPAGTTLIGGVILDVGVVGEVGGAEVGPDAVGAAEVEAVPLALGVGGAVALAVAAEMVVTIAPEGTARRGWKTGVNGLDCERKGSSTVSGPHPCWWRVCYQRGLPRLVFTSW